MKKQKIIAVVGPTASGKSALALRLAEKHGGEIVSCDSMQVYRGMDIGTAKPTASERARVPHHLIDVADPASPYSCAEFVAAAKDAIADIGARGALPILCGGTGLYLDRLLSGGVSAEAPEDPELRQRLFAFAAQNGNRALYERLLAVDPESAAKTHENNVKRVVRALEIYELTGRTKSETDRETQTAESLYDAAVIGLFAPEKELLNGRIDRRVDEMLSMGLAEETARLESAGVFSANATAAQAIGYKELLPYLHGECDLSSAAERLRTATHQYAKRQMTWFRAKAYVRWIPISENGVPRSADAILADAEEICGAHLTGN